MKTVSELLKSRPARRVIVIKPDDSVLEAITVLARENIGAAVVLQDDELAGIFSERDYTRKVILQGRASDSTKVSEIMTSTVIVVTPHTHTRECMALMTERNIRHLPVVENGQVVGMVSIRDIVGDIIADQDFTIQQLEQYISGS